MITSLSLRSQFILLVFFCIAGTIGATSYHIIGREHKLLEKTVGQQARLLGASSAVLFTNAFVYEELGLLNGAGMEEYLDYYVGDMMAMDSRIVSFMTLNNNSRIVTHNDPKRYGEFYEIDNFDEIMAAGQIVVRPYQQQNKALEILVPLVIESKRWGMCRIVFSLHEVAGAMETLQLEVLRVASLSLLLSLLLISFAAEYFIRPLQKLSDAMGKITVQGDVSAVLPDLPERRDEIGQLQQSFHWMASRLQKEEKQRLQTREQLFHTEKMATIGALTASMAHEINNPLGGVILCFNNLCGESLDEGARRQHIEVIQQSLDRMKKTMRDLLDYSRQSDLAIQAVAPKEIVEKSLGLVETMLRQKNIELQVDLPEGLPSVMVDIAKIQQIVVNLIVNAAHVMEGGGILKVGVLEENSTVLIVVSDTGSGIPLELQEKIFDPFFTTKEVGKGTGLGLALSRSIAEQHGGKLLLLETGEQGSSFALILQVEGKKNGE